MSLAGGTGAGARVGRGLHVSCVGRSSGLIFEEGWGLRGSAGVMLGGWEWALYSEVQCIMGNDHMGTPVNRQTDTTKNITFLQLHW